MSPADIDVFLEAKRQILWVGRARAIILLVVAIGLGAVMLTFDLGDYGNLFTGFVLGAAAYSFGERANGARDKLIELVERQINRDPAALRYLAGADHAR